MNRTQLIDALTAELGEIAADARNEFEAVASAAMTGNVNKSLGHELFANSHAKNAASIVDTIRVIRARETYQDRIDGRHEYQQVVGVGNE